MHAITGLLISLSIFLPISGNLSPEPVIKIPYRIQPQLDRIQQISFELEGTQHALQDSIIKNWLLPLPVRNPYMLGMFADSNKNHNENLLPWSGEFAGKHLTGALTLYRLFPNPELKQQLDQMIQQLSQLQTPNGYLGPWPAAYELTCRMPPGGGFPETWDTWDHYHMMIGLLEYYRQFENPQALEICRKIGDRLCQEFLGKPDQMLLTQKTGWWNGGMEFNLSPVQSLCILYRYTGDQNYLKLAEQIVQEGFSRYGQFVQRALAGKDYYATDNRDGARWERLHPIMGLAELYWLTGNPDYRKAFEQIWWSIAGSDIHNTGGFSTSEMAIGNPYTEGAIETCCTVAWQALSVEMLKMTGNSVVADMLELAQLNAAYASWDPSGNWSTYHTGMIGQRRPNTVEIGFQIRPGTEQLNCCSVNAPRGIGMLADWALMQHGTDLALNWYGAGTVRTLAAGKPVRLIQSTSYPANGQIKIRIEPEHATQFTLWLRIPFWSNHTTLTLNGKPLSGIIAGSYYKINRNWNKGDLILLNLDMQTQIWPGEQQYAGYGAIYHGPVLLAWKRPEQHQLQVQPDTNWNPWPGFAYQTDKTGARIETEFEGDQISMVYDQYPDGGMIRLRLDHQDAGVLNLFTPKINQLQEWTSKKLKPGKHLLEAEILSGADSASKGHTIRIREFRQHQLPVLNARTLRLQPNSAYPRQLQFTCIDMQGHEIHLEDYNSAGHKGTYYYTWLPMRGLRTGRFSKQYPLRTIRLNQQMNY